jgi:hypothetical protein
MPSYLQQLVANVGCNINRGDDIPEQKFLVNNMQLGLI